MAYNALVKIQMKRASTSDWNRTTDTGSAWSGYLLREAEIGVEVFTDNSVKLKVGNGINTWKDLPYVDAKSAKYVTTLPPIAKAEAGIFYVYNGLIYYTTDNVNWNRIGGVYKFDDLDERPKYNGTTITSKTNIPKSATTASDLKYVNTSSGLSATNVQQALDEINSNIRDSLDKSHISNTVYGVDGSGNQESIPYSSSKIADTIVKRTSLGTIKAANPTDDDDVVIKSYYDKDIGLIKTDVANNTSSINNMRGDINTNTNSISNIKTDVSTMKTNIANNTTNINTNKIDISNLKNQLGTMSSGISDNKNDISALKTKVDNNITNIINLQKDLTTEQTTRYNNDIKSLSMTGSSTNIITLTKNDNSTFTTTIPLASLNTSGLITKEAYKQIQDNSQDIEDLKNQGGRYIGQSFATKADLDKFDVSKINVGDFTFVVDDETHKEATTKYFCVQEGSTKKFKFAYVIEYDPIGIATNTELGLVLSSNTKGKILVETDGTMSLIGYDDILSKFNDYVLKEAGKGLSSNDYTPTDKTKVGLITTTGTGNSFLADDGSYKTIVIPETDGIKDVQSGGASVVNVLGVAELHKVASTGNYNDLTNIPTTLVKDANYVHTDYNFTKSYKELLNNLNVTGDGSKFLADDGSYYQLSDVAKTGSYNDLTDVPQNLVQDANYIHTDNNFTTALKTKLDNLKSDGEANKINSVSVNNTALIPDATKNINIDLTSYALKTSIPTKISQLTNDNNTVTDANYVHTDSNYTAAEKTKLSGIDTGAQANKIEIVKLNNNALPVSSTDKSINIDLSDYADKEVVDDLVTRVTNNETNIKSLQMSGLWRGIFNTKATLPTNAITSGASFIGGTVFVNDYVIIKEDETHKDAAGKPCKTRYYATNIADDGTITWTYFDKEEGSIATATNATLGLVKGTTYSQGDETTFGKISVASDGSMSVNGLDDLLGDYLPLKGNSRTEKTMTGPIWFKNNVGGIYGTMGGSDYYRIIGASTAEDSGYLELATSDNGTEPIYVRQYANNTTEGSSTDKFSSTGLKRTLTLLDASGNTVLPGSIILPGTGASTSQSTTKIVFGKQDLSTTYGVIRTNTAKSMVFSDSLTNNTNAWVSTMDGTYNNVSPANEGSVVSKVTLGTTTNRWETVYNKVSNISSKAIFSDKVTQQYNSDEECIEFIFN